MRAADGTGAPRCRPARSSTARAEALLIDATSSGITGRTGNILSGEGRLGTTVNGALGNISGGLTADVWNQQDGATIREDALTNAATGALGNAAGHARFHDMEGHGSMGGENLSDRGKLTDAAYKNSFGTGLNTAIYSAGSGIESDLQNLAEDADEAGEGAK
ncbi:hypothetical protein ACWQ06_30120 [Streptomyces angustmyceticus]